MEGTHTVGMLVAQDRDGSCSDDIESPDSVIIQNFLNSQVLTVCL
jgi:hypothetical protein